MEREIKVNIKKANEISQESTKKLEVMQNKLTDIFDYDVLLFLLKVLNIV